MTDTQGGGRGPQRTDSCDFAILAAQDREVLALLRLADRVEEQRFSGNVLYRLELRGSDDMWAPTTLTGVVAAVGGVGRVEAAIATSHLLQVVSPRWLFLVGVAGGFAANDVELGDVIVASRIVDYETQRLSQEEHEFRPRLFDADTFLLEAGRLAGSTNWPHRLMCPERKPPRLHFGTVLSGDKVVASAEVVSSFLERDPRALGVEMEGAGVAAAAVRSGRELGFLMIRGVVDLANRNKRDDADIWLDCACDAAAMFAFATIGQAAQARPLS
jgi:nucleoside phosphorylase